MPQTAALRPDGTIVSRPWGSFQTIEEGAGYKVKRLVVAPGCRLSLQRHRHRAEHWVVVAGMPRVIVSGRAQRLRERGTVSVPRGAWHRIENPGIVPVVIIEVQHGPYLGEDDIIRREDDYGRADAKPQAAPRPVKSAGTPPRLTPGGRVSARSTPSRKSTR
ncbi:MAG TPA: phosphomannose isomerase type II C-terminal cupin domain [Candidatus Methylomirabilis sp.]|nr:phosphomannose isomerase type II C-terminal cupin domain [Candidatus Methylomirabilis sp.]